MTPSPPDLVLLIATGLCLLCLAALGRTRRLRERARAEAPEPQSDA